MKYDKDLLRSMVDKVNLYDYASQSFDFTRHSGDSWYCSCPLHVDKTPSLAVNEKENYFYCFSCGKGGDIIDWMRTYEGLSWEAAVEKLSKLTGTEIKEYKQCESLNVFKKIKALTERKEKKKVRVYLDAESYEKYSDELPQEWLDEGISAEAMKRFNIRVDKSSNRIVYPVYDADYRYICPKGRTRYVNYKEMGLNKYINYSKIGTTDFFVGMKENHEAIAKHNKIIVFEGIKSVMKAYDWGYDYCVAAETSMLNEDQVKLLLKLGVKEVTIAFDSDVDIKKITESTRMLRRFTTVYVIRDRNHLLKEKEAPVDEGKDVFEQLMRERIRL